VLAKNSLLSWLASSAARRAESSRDSNCPFSNAKLARSAKATNMRRVRASKASASWLSRFSAPITRSPLLSGTTISERVAAEPGVERGGDFPQGFGLSVGISLGLKQPRILNGNRRLIG